MTFRTAWTGICLVSLGLVASGVVGCGDDEGDAVGIPLDQFAGVHREATCQHIVACNFMPDQATCMATVRTDADVAQAVAAAQAGSLSYSAGAARTCADAIAQQSCDGDLLFPRALRQTCDAVFGERGGEGDPCFRASECQGIDATCQGICSDSCCQGTCVLGGATAEAGEACDDAIRCREDAYCGDDGMGARICQSRVGPGDECDTPSACQTGYACDPGTRTCFRQAESGAACNPDLAADGCLAIAEYCDAESRVCTKYPGAGKACATNALASNFCAPFADCDTAAMTCVAKPGLGGACDVFSGQCLSEGQAGYGFGEGLSCNGAVCEPTSATPACIL